jgi:hypothetical protein
LSGRDADDQGLTLPAAAAQPGRADSAAALELVGQMQREASAGHPTGCSIEMAPPLTLTLSAVTPSSRMDWMATDANASLISNRSAFEVFTYGRAFRPASFRAARGRD